MRKAWHWVLTNMSIESSQKRETIDSSAKLQ